VGHDTAKGACRAMSLTALRVQLAGGSGARLGIRDADRMWSQGQGDGWGDRCPVIYDLSDAPYLDQEGLPYILGLLKGCRKEGREVWVDLPEPDSTRMNFLRGWRFIEAVDAIAKDKESFWTPRSRSIIDSLGKYVPRYLKIVSDPEGGVETLLPDSFFALTPLVVDRGTKFAARRERSKWLDEHIIGVLDRQLIPSSPHETAPAKDLATEVVYEAVLNAANHANARSSYTSSQIQISPSWAKPRPPELVINIWDDGESFARTLSSAFSAHGTVMSPTFGMVDERFRCVFNDEETKSSETIELRTVEWKVTGREQDMMLGAFILGVTSSPTPSNDDMQLSDALGRFKSGVLRTARGAGLHLLRDAAISEFGGTVGYCTGRYRMKLSKSKHADIDYDINLRKLSAKAPVIDGNLLTIRLPLHA
jgi:hypothetical protein